MIEHLYECPFCRGLYYVSGELPIRVICPHCGSFLKTYRDKVELLERGIIPIPAPGRKGPIGFIGGFIIGSAIGGIPAGLLLGLLSYAAGNKAETASEAIRM